MASLGYCYTRTVLHLRAKRTEYGGQVAVEALETMGGR